jgi:hypothetical protein
LQAASLKLSSGVIPYHEWKRRKKLRKQMQKQRLHRLKLVRKMRLGKTVFD